MYRIRQIGDPVLRRETDQIKEFDDKLISVVQNMLVTMHEAEGIGLAAPQVGISKKIVVVDISSVEEKDLKPKVFINPAIIDKSGESVIEEGCLSIPGIREDVARPESVTVEYFDEIGNKLKNEFSGWMARVLQHEIDHLNGILFVDLISPVKRELLKQKGLLPESY